MINRNFVIIKFVALIVLLSLMLCSFIYIAGPSYGDDKKLLISTDLGDIEIILYDKTPLHRDNFLKLVKENYYDGMLFHRVISDFMIQTGDPGSKNAAQGAHLGNGGPGYTIPAEFVPEYLHKKGAVAAARQPDNINPEKESSGSQFYIVQGKVFSDKELDKMENKINQARKNSYFTQYITREDNSAIKHRLDSLKIKKDNESLNRELQTVLLNMEKEMRQKGLVFSFSPKQREIYKTVGGAPHLDGGYTVFGEVVSGLDIVEKISDVETDKGDRPVKDIHLTINVKD